jgi:addiction module HigA family antidote
MTRIKKADDEVFEFPDGISLPPVHPGRTVAAELRVRGISGHRAALMMRVPANRLALILAGRRAITADTALRLARLLGTSAQFWMSLQAQYELAVTERAHGKQIAAEVVAA